MYMEVVNIVDIFKTYIEDIAPEEDKQLFEDIFLGKRFSSDSSCIYSMEEYFDNLHKIMQANGQGYTYGEFGYIEREPISIEQAVSHPTSYTESLQKSIIYPFEKSPVYMKFIRDFNTFVLNPAFPFILFDKIYEVQKDVFHAVMHKSQAKCELDGMFERWRDYFTPIVKDYCSYNYYFTNHNHRFVYTGPTDILVSDRVVTNKMMNSHNVAYRLYLKTSKIKQMFNYE